MANLCTGTSVDLKSQGITDIFIPPMKLKESSSPLSSVHRSGNIIYKSTSSKGVQLREVASPRAGNKAMTRNDDLDSFSDATTTREVIERVYANENKLYHQSNSISRWQQETTTIKNAYESNEVTTLPPTGPQYRPGGMMACCGGGAANQDITMGQGLDDLYMSSGPNVVNIRSTAPTNLDRTTSAVRVTTGKPGKSKVEPLQANIVVHSQTENEWKGPSAIVVQKGVEMEPMLVESTVPPTRMFACCGGGKFIPVDAEFTANIEPMVN